jgi:hypothetical protein
MADQNQMDSVTKLLTGALAAPGPFVYREDAKSWLDRITAKPK